MSRPPLSADDPRHGTATGYMNHGCRLDCCARAMRQYRASRRARTRQLAKARKRALKTLLSRHYDEYRELCAKERARLNEQ